LEARGLLGDHQEAGGSPSNTLYVGDSITDAETARRAGVLFAAVLNGVMPMEAFKDYPAYRVLDKFGELIDQS
jgi:phosphoglycolate phosphatase